jgi:hypothetical protein
MIDDAIDEYGLPGVLKRPEDVWQARPDGLTFSPWRSFSDRFQDGISNAFVFYLFWADKLKS